MASVSAVSRTTSRAATQAIIGTNTASGTATGSSTWNVPGTVNVNASESGDVVNFALAAAVATAPSAAPSGNGQQAAAAPPSFGSWGLQVSGDASYTKATDNTLAYINDAGTFTTGAMTVGATDQTILVGFGGSYAGAYLSKQSVDTVSTDNLGIAGSYAEIDLGGSTDAFIQDAQLAVAGALSITAERDNYVGTLTFAGAGTSIDGSLEVAGSVALDFFSGDTDAYLNGVSGTVSGDLTVTATDNTIYVAIGGGVSVSGFGGLGLSFGYISITHSILAYADDTSLGVGGDVEITATANTDVGSLGLALGFTKGQSTFAGAGNASVNTIEMTVEAYISDDSDITSDESVSVESTDNSYLVSVSGGIAIGTQASAAVGAAASYNLINNTIEAYISNSTVKANGGTFTVSATSTPKLIAVAAGGTDADKVAIGGSVTVNSVANTVTADIDSSTVSSSGDLSVTASEDAMEVVIAGAIAIASGAAFGAAVAYNYVGESFNTANPDDSAHGTSTSSCRHHQRLEGHRGGQSAGVGGVRSSRPAALPEHGHDR